MSLTAILVVLILGAVLGALKWENKVRQQRDLHYAGLANEILPREEKHEEKR
jgi:hypothetical protein